MLAPIPPPYDIFIAFQTMFLNHFYIIYIVYGTIGLKIYTMYILIMADCLAEPKLKHHILSTI